MVRVSSYFCSMSYFVSRVHTVCWITFICCWLTNTPMSQFAVGAGMFSSADMSTRFVIEGTWMTTESKPTTESLEFLTDFAENRTTNETMFLTSAKGKSVKATVTSISSDIHDFTSDTNNTQFNTSSTMGVSSFTHDINSTIAMTSIFNNISLTKGINNTVNSTTLINDTSFLTHFNDTSSTINTSDTSSAILESNTTATTYINNTSSITHVSNANSTVITNPTTLDSSTTNVNNANSIPHVVDASSTTQVSTTRSTSDVSGTNLTTISDDIISTTGYSTTSATDVRILTEGDSSTPSFTEFINITSSTNSISSTTSFATTNIIRDLDVDYNDVEPETDEPYVPQCGQIFTKRPLIVGGMNSLSREFPWAVSVRVLSTHFCGGTIINKDWVLTAAHCVKRFAARYFRVRLGGQDVDIDKFRPQWDIQVSEIVLHPKFGSPARYSYDIALLKLKRSIGYREFAFPVCLPENLDESFEGWNVTVVGWGRRNEMIDVKSSVLQKAIIPVVNNSICAEWYSQVYFGYIQVRDFQICAGEKDGGKDSCKGDSGGPLVVLNERGRYTLVGVVSAGVGCGRSHLPGIYSRVSYFVPWILKVTGGYSWPVPPSK